MLASRIYPALIHQKRWARNGFVPDAKLAKALVRAQNHAMAYRLKTFMSWSDNLANPFAGASGTTTLHRFRCHTGFGATHIEFNLGVVNIQADGLGTNPRVDIDVTIAGGATTTVTRYIGANEDGSSAVFAPDNISQWKIPVPVSADTTYEVAIKTVDYARIAWCTAYEKASNVVDANTAWFVEDNPSAFFPVYSTFRRTLLQGMSEIWKRNGSHLYSWTGNSGAASPLFSGNTWTNIVDDTTAVSSSSTPIYLGDDNVTMQPWCRISESTTLRVVLAVHATVSSTVGGTGEIRLANGTGAHISFTGISASDAWQATTTTAADVTAFTRLDIQARTSTAANTGMTLNALSLYCYVA